MYPPQRYLRDAADNVLPGDTVVQAKALVAFFFCVCGVAQTIFGPAFNPLTPAHNVVYRVTGVPNPRAVAVAAAAVDKSKED